MTAQIIEFPKRITALKTQREQKRKSFVFLGGNLKTPAGNEVLLPEEYQSVVCSPPLFKMTVNDVGVVITHPDCPAYLFDGTKWYNLGMKP